MEVRVLLGPAGAGKTFRTLEALRSCERAGRRALLLVPDQFTYAADRLLLEESGLAGTRFVRVLSFRRLTHLLATRAGLTTAVLSEQGRRMLLRRIVHGATPADLGPLAPLRTAPGLVEALAAAVGETKGIAGRDAAARLAAAAGDNEKVAALARMIAAYDHEVEAVDLIDPEERVRQAAAALAANPHPWRERVIWIDGFASFTPGEKDLLLALAQATRSLTLTLCGDPADAELLQRRASEALHGGLHAGSEIFFDRLRPELARPAFLPTLRTLAWLLDSCGGSLTLEPLRSGAHRFRQAGELARLEAELFRSRRGAAPGAAGEQPAPRVTILHQPHPYHEVVAWARLIDGWTRLADTPIRYRQIALLMRDLETYRPLIQEVFRRYRIPFFIDERRDAAAHPLMRLVLAALRLAAQGWHREAVISVLRNPALGLTPDRVDGIENLSLEYGIEFERWWETRWETFALPARDRLHRTSQGDELPDDEPEPQDEADSPDADDPRREERVTRIQRRRRLAAAAARGVAERVFPTLRRFTATWQAGDPDFATAAKALSDMVDALAGGPVIAARSYESWSEAESTLIAGLLQETLADGVRLMATVPTSAAAFTRLLKSALTGTAVGLTPRILDAVLVAEPRRSRVNEVHTVILGGLDAQSFPRPPAEDPLFNDRERIALADRGLPLGAFSRLQGEEEPYLFYVACTRATDRLVLSRAGLGEDGGRREPSPYLLEIEQILGERIAPAELAPGAGMLACRHPQELPTQLATTLLPLEAPDRAALLTRAREDLPDAAPEIDRSEACAERILRPLPVALPPALAVQLFPHRLLATSASRFETYAQCPFKHFAQHLLRLEPRPESRLTPRSTGSAAHEALQRFFAAGTLPTDGDEAAARMRAIFAELGRAEQYRVFQEDPPSAYRWQRTGRTLEQFVRTELLRLAGSRFRPHALELSFGLEAGDGKSLPALAIEIDAATAAAAGLAGEAPWRVHLRGQIDRLDVAPDPTDRPAALIIDYKQSARAMGRTEDLKRGLGMQVATYLLAIRELMELEPVGGLYYTTTPQPRRVDESVPPENRMRFKMQGIFLEEERERIDARQAFLPRRAQRTPSGALDALEPTLSEVRQQITRAAAEILRGMIAPFPAPTQGRLPCDYCEYGAVCRFDRRSDPVRAESERSYGGD